MFRPLTYFQSIEGFRGDEHEGHHLSELAGARLEIWDEKIQAYTAPIDMIKGQFLRKLLQPERVFVKCFSTNPQLDYGPTTIRIFEVEEFLKRVCRPLKQALGIEVGSGLVRYYRPDEAPRGLVSAEQMWLFKREQYAKDSEFRIAFFTDANQLAEQLTKIDGVPREMAKRTLNGSIKLKVGSLNDVACIV